MKTIQYLIKVVGNQNKRGSRGPAILGFMLAMSLAGSLCLCGGCKRHPTGEGADAPGLSPEVSSNLTVLTGEVRLTMRLYFNKTRTPLKRDFATFAGFRTDLTIPDPPPGKKYIINEKWKVALVDR
jgi:hypothetical protein